MFIMTMPKSLRVGDSADCRINDTPRRLTWRDERSLVIEPDDARTIISRVSEDGLTTFWCADPGEPADAYGVTPDQSGAVLINRR